MNVAGAGVGAGIIDRRSALGWVAPSALSS